jgi:hypothetical protein
VLPQAYLVVDLQQAQYRQMRRFGLTLEASMTDSPEVRNEGIDDVNVRGGLVSGAAGEPDPMPSAYELEGRVGMVIRVQVLGHPRVFDLSSVDAGAILHPQVEPAPDLYETGFEHGFDFSPTGDPTPAKSPSVFGPAHYPTPLPSFNVSHI